jgi:hypothetical protein
MLNTLEYPSEGAESSSLAAVLEVEDVSTKYYLSATACEGILRRANRRGKVLPQLLLEALENQSLVQEKI